MGLGGKTVAWPIAAGAQQQTPAAGYLGATSRGKDTRILGSLREGRFVEGQNVASEYR
jgi:hypothetical protein